MDALSINESAINGQGQGALATAVVDGRVFALLSGGGRVISRRLVDARAQATIAGGGRVTARSAEVREAKAIDQGSSSSVVRRSIVDGAAEAEAHVSGAVTRRSLVAGVAAASWSQAPHINRRSVVDASASAIAVARSRATRRTPISGQASAVGAVGVTVFPRREVRHLIAGQAAAVGDVRLRGVFSVPINGQAFARLLGSGGGINNQFPFDEPAPIERRFSAPQRPPTFTVTEMPLVGSATQQPSDIHDYDVDFSTWFPPGDNIISATVTASPAMPQPPSTAINGLTVKVWVYDEGTSGLTYTLTLRAITSDGRQKEVELQIKVREE